jgi:hypothetical protein
MSSAALSIARRTRPARRPDLEDRMARRSSVRNGRGKGAGRRRRVVLTRRRAQRSRRARAHAALLGAIGGAVIALKALLH